jgi:hypothetical protein
MYSYSLGRYQPIALSEAVLLHTSQVLYVTQKAVYASESYTS